MFIILLLSEIDKMDAKHPQSKVSKESNESNELKLSDILELMRTAFIMCAITKCVDSHCKSQNIFYYISMQVVDAQKKVKDAITDTEKTYAGKYLQDVQDILTVHLKEEYEKCIKSLHSAIRSNPDDKHTHFRLQVDYATQQNDPQELHYAKALYNYHIEKEYKKCIDSLASAIRSYPSEIHTYFHLKEVNANNENQKLNAKDLYKYHLDNMYAFFLGRV